jgi:hypothetical protein
MKVQHTRISPWPGWWKLETISVRRILRSEFDTVGHVITPVTIEVPSTVSRIVPKSLQIVFLFISVDN